MRTEIDGILRRVDLSPGQMELLLEEHALVWKDFELSVHNYLVLDAYQNEILLADVPFSDRQAYLQDWLAQEYRMADITFEEEFLDEINAPEDLSPVGSDE